MAEEKFDFFWPQLDAAVYGIFDSYSQRDTLDIFVLLPPRNPVLAALVVASTVPPNLDPVTPSSPPVSTITSPSLHQIHPLLHSRKSTPPQTTTLPQALHHQRHARTRCPIIRRHTNNHRPVQVNSLSSPIGRQNTAPRPTCSACNDTDRLFAPSTIALVSLRSLEEDDGNIETNALIGFGLSHVEGAFGHLILSFDLEEDNGPPPIIRNQIVPLDIDAKIQRFPNYVHRFEPMEKWENEFYGPCRNHGDDGPIFFGGLRIDESIR
ncbi:hypothetical protein OROMI_027328 [Orobanche minor]